MAAELAELPGTWGRLHLAQVPDAAGSERTGSTKGEAPIPNRLAALTLIAGGSDAARCMFVPAVRTWTTVESGGAGPDGNPIMVRIWHREPSVDERGRPVMTLVNDQTGVLPIREWLRAWAQEWRGALGHSTDRPRPQRRRPAAAPKPADWPADPVAREWDRRWAATGWGLTARHDYEYLSRWLPVACDRVPHIGDFAVSLRTLTGAIRFALGDNDDLEYLGRCPEEIDDHAAGTTSICGAAIWHDPFASMITCPRCHTETPQDRRIWLARRILDTWPIDPRRRYPRALIEVLRMPACVTCSKRLAVEWIDATERADREPYWRPGSFACPAGCEAVT